MAINNINSIGVDDITFRYRTGAGPGGYMSGALFCSGGKLIFVGASGPETITSV